MTSSDEKVRKVKAAKKRLLIATDCFLPRKDGIARFLAEMMPYLVDEFDVTVLAPEYKGDIPKSILQSVKLVRFPLRRIKVGDFQPSRPRHKIVKKAVLEADIIWTQTIGPIGAMTVWTASRQGKPIVSYIHSIENELMTRSIALRGLRGRLLDWVSRRFLRFCYNRSGRLIVPSEQVASILRGYGVTTEMSVVHMGIDADHFRPCADKAKAKKAIHIKPEHFVIGYTGRIAKEKDLIVLKRAFTHLKDRRKDLFLLIVGDGPMDQKCIFASEDMKVTGFVDDVLPYLRAMDVFVLPSQTETSSLSTMEAMAAGLPVVVTPVGFIKTYVAHKHNGLIFQVGDIEGLADHIEELMDDEGLRRRLGANARKTICHSYNWKKTAGGIIDILRRISKA